MQGIDDLYYTNISNGYCVRLTVFSGSLLLYEGDTFRTLPMISMALWSNMSPYADWYVGESEDIARALMVVSIDNRSLMLFWFYLSRGGVNLLEL